MVAVTATQLNTFNKKMEHEMLPKYGLEPFMISTRERSAEEILNNLCSFERISRARDEDYTKTKDDQVSYWSDHAPLAPGNLITRLKTTSPTCDRGFLCIDFDFLNPIAQYIMMKYGSLFTDLLHSVELLFKTFFDKWMKISEFGTYFAMSLEPANELSFMTRSVIIPQSRETLKLFPDMLQYYEEKFTNFCDEAEVQLNRNSRQIMKYMLYLREGGDPYMDLTTDKMLPDKDDYQTHPLRGSYPDL